MLLVIAGVVVLVLALQSTVLDAAAVERDVAAQFEQREGVAIELDCPDDMKVEAGRHLHVHRHDRRRRIGHPHDRDHRRDDRGLHLDRALSRSSAERVLRPAERGAQPPERRLQPVRRGQPGQRGGVGRASGGACPRSAAGRWSHATATTTGAASR